MAQALRARTAESVRAMRVVPFDLRSVVRLVLSAGTPMLPVAAKLLPLPPRLREIVDLLL